MSSPTDEVARLRIALRAARDLARIAETTRSRAAEWARQEERERMQREVDAQRETNAALTAEVERLRSQLAREAMLRLLDEVARLRALTLAVSIERDTIEVERDEARREAERLRIALRAAPLK